MGIPEVPIRDGAEPALEIPGRRPPQQAQIGTSRVSHLPGVVGQPQGTRDERTA